MRTFHSGSQYGVLKIDPIESIPRGVVESERAMSEVSAHRGNVGPLLSFRGIVKQFGDTLAVDHVDLDILPGEIHALLGANGAGKSTLIKILAGIHRPDEGEIYLKGQRVHPEPRSLPIAFIHQDLGLIEWMTVAENIALVSGYARRRGLIDWEQTAQKAQKCLDIVGGGIHPDTPVMDLTRTEKSLVAIARALVVEADLLVLDEPTSSLPESDVARLFATLARLRDRGMGMIYVTHRLDEVFRIADRVTVLRDGRRVATSRATDTTPTDLIVEIVGRPPSELFSTPPPPSAQPKLELRSVRSGRAGPITLHVMEGEILGLVGLRGGGQEVIGRAICGLETMASGSVVLQGKPINTGRVDQVIRQGISFVTSKRQEEGLAMTLSVKENLFLNPALRGRHILNLTQRGEEQHQAISLMDRFGIRPSNPERTVAQLSGGNQQKVVLARWLDLGSKLLVLEEPTIGVDVGTKSELYAILNDAASHGASILLISSDFEEVVNVCHRALIFNRGRIVAELQRDDLSVATITRFATGALDGRKG